jgi:predicted enzyme related to lactoylglutathione lyase
LLVIPGLDEEGAPMQVKGIKWVGVCTADWDRAVAFYRDVLGLPVRDEGLLSVGTGRVRCAELALPDGDFVELFDENLAERGLFATPVVGFLVEDVAEARREMEARGACFIGPVYRRQLDVVLFPVARRARVSDHG